MPASQVIKWDAIEIPMPSVKMRNEQLNAAQCDTERTMRILVIEKQDLICIDDLIPRDTLTDEQQEVLLNCLSEFRPLLSGKIGTLKMPPYELPIDKSAKPFAMRPFPIPQIYKDATHREIQILVGLGVLEPDKDSPWASPSFISPRRMARSDFYLIFAC